ncbi:MAG: RNA polymerase factor sigma-54 [Bacteroidaceae bacterium]|nr:RNA polymerase factor sigma-54 [Bacteroidaceae bacterium]MBQ9169699.1 RNA polymerase factor sigma-54 [Bacteroidaceae bacterium]MBQ9294140.1 RNA polymerase factor sigma-54 [Bacteroidaceae bacterium]
MSQKNLQTQSGQQVQTQQQVQQQQLLPQQVLLVRLTEMPVEALQQRVEQECMENPWLEVSASPDPSEGGENGETDGWLSPRSEGSGEADVAFDYRSEEDMPDFLSGPSHSNDAAEYVSYDDTLSLTDRLREQMADFELTDHEKELMEYLIGSLDEDGLLGKSLPVLADEAELYQGITTSPEELEKVLHVLQQFDPPGIGARSLQECLLLQVRRDGKFPYREKFITLLSKYFDDFVHKRWSRLAQKLHVSLWDTEQMQKEVLRLNPRPGGSIGSKTSDRILAIQPDFLVDTDDDGTVTVTLAKGNQPSLVISPDAEGQKDAFVRQYVERGQMFITALQQRSETMMRTMQAIVSFQKPFFQTGDETLLRPMKLDDIASATGYDISTISRAAGSKYVETPFGTYPLKWLFSLRATKTDEGDDVTARQVKAVLHRIIEKEDKQEPLSDEHLTQMLRQKGFNIARRTVAKYREQMGIPVARMRK